MDRRQVEVSLTPAGHVLHGPAGRMWSEWEALTVADLMDDDVHHLQDLLTGLLATLRATCPDRNARR